MVSLERTREILGDAVKGMTDEEVLRIRDTMDDLVGLLLDWYLEDIETKRETT